MKRSFHIILLLGILIICLYAVMHYSGQLHQKCNEEWRMNFIDDPSPLIKVGMILIK